MTSPCGELHVEPSHLRDLSKRQSDAAVLITEAAPLTASEADAVLHSHGIICRSTHLAAQSAAAARAKACTAMQMRSEAFVANLDSAADKYSWTDQDSGSKIDGKMRPGFR